MTTGINLVGWRCERAALHSFTADRPFPVPRDQHVRALTPRAQQKLEILKQLSVGRSFDTGRLCSSPRGMRSRVADLVAVFKVKTATRGSPVQTLPKGNPQQAFLARDLSGKGDLLIISEGKIAGDRPIAQADSGAIGQQLGGLV